MTAILEGIVRPFQTGDVFTKSRQPPNPVAPTVVVPDDVATTWEGSPDTDFTDEGDAWYSGWDGNFKEDKTQRSSRTVKVVNPDDADQHVFVERIDKAVFKDQRGTSLNLAFDWSDPKDGGS